MPKLKLPDPQVCLLYRDHITPFSWGFCFSSFFNSKPLSGFSNSSLPFLNQAYQNWALFQQQNHTGTKTSLLAHLCFAQPRMTKALWLGADLPCQLHLKLRSVCIQDRKPRSLHHQWLNLLYFILLLKTCFSLQVTYKSPGQDSVFLDYPSKHWEIPSVTSIPF